MTVELTGVDGAGMEEQGMSLRKRARSLRRADSASELPLLREAMAAPEGASKPAEESEDEGVFPHFIALAKSRCCCLICCLSRSIHGMHCLPSNSSIDTVQWSSLQKGRVVKQEHNLASK